MFDYKDASRIAGIMSKSYPLHAARNMARVIKSADKALRRAEAAAAVNQHTIAAVFFVRYGELKAVR